MLWLVIDLITIKDAWNEASHESGVPASVCLCWIVNEAAGIRFQMAGHILHPIALNMDVGSLS